MLRHLCLLAALASTPLHAQVSSYQGLKGAILDDGKNCVLTSNPSIAGRMNEKGTCIPLTITGGGSVSISISISISTITATCEEGWTLVWCTPSSPACAKEVREVIWK